MLIFKFTEKGTTFNPNPRRNWVFENEFVSKCKVLLNEFENTVSERNGKEQYTLKDIAGDEIKYFVKIDIGSKMKPDFQDIEAKMCEEMRIRLREFTDIPPSSMSRCCSTPPRQTEYMAFELEPEPEPETAMIKSKKYKRKSKKTKQKRNKKTKKKKYKRKSKKTKKR
jgi:hypothetical protein